MSQGIKVNGIRDFEKFLAKQPALANKAAALAINDITRKSYSASRKLITAKVNLPKSYLDGVGAGSPRLQIIKLASEKDLSSIIRGRQRATSLARFDPKQLYRTGKNGKSVPDGVSIRVAAGRKKIPKAFLLNLKRGNADTGNVGLAIRVPAGENIKGKHTQGRPLGGSGRADDVYLLYGPSVQQVFSNVIDELTPKIDTDLGDEFNRQFERLSRG